MLKSKLSKLIRPSLGKVKQYRKRRYLKWLYQIEREKYYAHATALDYQNSEKKVSIIVPCYNTPKKYLDPLVDSIFNQGYQNWELVLADGSTESSYSDYIESKSRSDSRIIYEKITNGGIAKNTNQGIMIATGDYIAFMDHDDTLDADALAECIRVLEEHSDFGLVYSDEDKVSDDGDLYLDPHFKPGFSLDMLRNVNYITHFVVVRKEIVDKLGGIREGFDGAQDYDFLLRVVDEGIKIAHIPKVLYHWRIADGSTSADFTNKQNVLDAGCRALNDHYERRGIEMVKTLAIPNRPGFYRPQYTLPDLKRAIIINLDGYDLTDDEKSYVYDRYKALEAVRMHGIAVVAGNGPAGKYDTIFHINGPMLPINDDQDIIGLFGLAEEKGVSKVSPMITSHGKILEMGEVRDTQLGTMQLFKNVSMDRNDFFGSIEWVRNVDIAPKLAYVESNVGRSEGGRSVIWTHANFASFAVGRGTRSWSVEELNQLTNPNVAQANSVTLQQRDYIRDKLEELQ